MVLEPAQRPERERPARIRDRLRDDLADRAALRRLHRCDVEQADTVVNARDAGERPADDLKPGADGKDDGAVVDRAGERPIAQALCRLSLRAVFSTAEAVDVTPRWERLVRAGKEELDRYAAPHRPVEEDATVADVSV